MNNLSKRSVLLGGILGSTITILGMTGIQFFTDSTTLDQIGTKLTIMDKIIETNFIFDYEESTLVDGLYAGYMNALDDPYSTYFSKEDYAKFKEDTTGEYVGIGARVSVDPKDNTIVIVQPFTNGPADKAGIVTGDKILAVDGEEVTGDKLEEAVAHMKGEKGTEVILTVQSALTGKISDITVTRDEITIDTVTSEVLDDNIGYIKISSFDYVTSDQFDKAYDDLMAQEVDGLIIDLRNNPGGLLDVTVHIADRLCPEGTIVSTKDAQGNEEVLTSDAEQIDIPLVMLVNEYSASASEVLTGAVKDYGVGTVVGETTFGKGIVQRLYPLGDGSAMKLTIAEYFTPSGYALHGKGLTPDYEVIMDNKTTAKLNSLPHEEDNQLQKAIEVINQQTK